MTEDKRENIEDAIQREQELAAHLIAEDRERDLKEYFKEEKLRKKHEEKMEREVKHEKEQRTLAIDDLYKKLGDYEAHKFKQLVKDGVDVKFEVKGKESFHVLTHSKDRRMGSSSSGSGSGKGKKHKKKGLGMSGKNGKGIKEIEAMMKYGISGGGVGTQGHTVDAQFAAGTDGGGVAMGALMGNQMATHNLTVMNAVSRHGKKGLKGKHGKEMFGGKHGGHGYGESKKSKKDKNKDALSGHKAKKENEGPGTCDACTIF
jgi:hypothetical protein